MKDNNKKKDMATYWKRCIEETASDILGVLNIGPVAAIAFIGYLRGVRGGQLRTEGVFPFERGNPTTKAFKLYSIPEEPENNHLVLEVPRRLNLPEKKSFLGNLDKDRKFFNHIL